ncbi:winged helix-turn-helix transcriptional regulator [Nocardia sp. BSTN01]|uniref:MarR family winged helix-turn-helix transcriptional regulator n=1 Tax=Nocardia sp. BSTN01 TaxID=2783665 RepID=UPI00188F28A8|nr:MarR family winged helix-turn-helix transcriptional regulator [Nocardia sp. BSTN01]MBF4997634.1 winged helix-turn-helix transcriptional regulator [Nocardia sp. BSTN01]
MTEGDTSFPPLSERTSFLIGQLGFHIAYRFGDALAPLGIGPRHFSTLKLLQANDGQSQQQLCDTLRIHRNVMVGLVDDLEKRGFVERRRHPADRRAHAVHLLPAGQEMLLRVEPIVRELDDSIQEPLEPHEQAVLHELLDKVVAGAGLAPGVHPGLSRGMGPTC